MSCWSHVILEGYCTYSHMSEKEHVSYPIEALDKETCEFDETQATREKNKHYIPPSKRPKWCKKNNKKRQPNFFCLCDDKENKCPFFAYTDADEEDYKLFDKAWKQANKE